MIDDYSQNDNTIPLDCERHDNFLSYSHKNQALPKMVFFVMIYSLLLGIIYILIGIISGKLPSNNLFLLSKFFLASFAIGMIIDGYLVLFYDCEESYWLDEQGFHCRHQKLFWHFQKLIPLNSIQCFVLNSKIDYEENNSKTIYYFVNIITHNKPITILQFEEHEKNVPQWFVSTGNEILANLTGKDIDSLIVSDVLQSTPVNPSDDSDNPPAPKPQIINSSSRLNCEFLNFDVSIPSNCELREDYLSYSYQVSRRLTYLYALFFAFAIIVAICFLMGLFSITGEDCTEFGIITFIMICISLYGLLSSIRIKETGILDIDGFHHENQSLFFRSTKIITLNSIYEFRSGSNYSQSFNNSNTSRFIEIVTLGTPYHILINKDAALQEWIIDSGNAVLVNLRKKALKPQSINEETPSDNTKDVSFINEKSN